MSFTNLCGVIFLEALRNNYLRRGGEVRDRGKFLIMMRRAVFKLASSAEVRALNP